MHPIGGGAYLPMINALARAGHHVIYCNSRFRGTDSALLMEKVVEDLGECIKDAKNRLGYSKVVLAGWSGGGSLSVFYQQQAQNPTVTASPSGDGPDLTKLGLIPADGIMLLAAHISRHGTHDRVDGRVDPRRVRPVQARSRAGPVQPGQPQPAAVHRGVPGALPRRRRSRATGESPSGSRTNWPSSRPPAGPTTSSRSSCTAPWPTRAGWIPTVDPNERAPRHLLSGRSSGGEQQPRRPGAVLHAAQLAVPVELRRRQRRRGQVRPRHRGARAGDRQPRRRRLHAQPHPPAVRGDRASRQGDARDPRRQPLLRGTATSATRCARRSASAPTGCTDTGSCQR